MSSATRTHHRPQPRPWLHATVPLQIRQASTTTANTRSKQQRNAPPTPLLGSKSIENGKATNPNSRKLVGGWSAGEESEVKEAKESPNLVRSRSLLTLVFIWRRGWRRGKREVVNGYTGLLDGPQFGPYRILLDDGTSLNAVKANGCVLPDSWDPLIYLFWFG